MKSGKMVVKFGDVSIYIFEKDEAFKEVFLKTRERSYYLGSTRDVPEEFTEEGMLIDSIVFSMHTPYGVFCVNKAERKISYSNPYNEGFTLDFIPEVN
ncbi:hypothetical protein [Acanthopleuribacter pedis]|uniref:Uncharacterized protein n=1 Tax=Acanthopleuribacter pedis TaxID=442870 RepID=A0A8J7U4Q6_9BACT|nr:hypothetical protein [Acanthopleuribacter pedis]MBO1319693.1 hypothetical protein [Acanthopleuribacter pedis]